MLQGAAEVFLGRKLVSPIRKKQLESQKKRALEA